MFESGYRQDSEETDKELFDRAVKEALYADVIVFFAGLFTYAEAESYDRENLRLPECQNNLIDHLSSLGKELIIILQTGSAVEMPWINHVDSVLQMHLSGEGTGRALADVLTAKKNPSGKLTETYPVKLAHIPSYINRGDSSKVEYRESIFIGYRYYDKKELDVLFPFGHGLSYTQFRYDALKVQRSEEDLLVSLVVTNTGSSEGSEIVQLYIGLNEDAVIQPVRCLAAFKKISLLPGEKKTVCFSLPVRSFMYYNEYQKEFVFTTGKNIVEVGKSSRDIQLKTTVEITNSNRKYAKISRNTTLGELRRIPQIKDMTDAWLGALLQQFGLLDDQIVNAKELERSLFYMPLRNAVQISKGAFSFPELDGLIDQLNQILEELGILV